MPRPMLPAPITPIRASVENTRAAARAGDKYIIVEEIILKQTLILRVRSERACSDSLFSMLLPRAAAAARARLAPRTALSTVTESAPWYKRPLSLSSSESGWQLAVATWGFIIFVGVPWSYNRMLALTAPDPATRVTRHKDTVQQMVYELRCASGFFCVCFLSFGLSHLGTTGPLDETQGLEANRSRGAPSSEAG